MQVGLPWLKIESQNKESKTVSWFYNDHKDEKRHDVTDNVIDSINRLIIPVSYTHLTLPTTMLV